MDEVTLLPCPFCGGDAAIRGGSREGGYCVVCMNVGCFCALGEGYDRDAMPDHSFATEEEAAEKWNRRTHSAQPNETISNRGESK